MRHSDETANQALNKALTFSAPETQSLLKVLNQYSTVSKVDFVTLLAQMGLRESDLAQRVQQDDSLVYLVKMINCMAALENHPLNLERWANLLLYVVNAPAKNLQADVIEQWMKTLPLLTESQWALLDLLYNERFMEQDSITVQSLSEALDHTWMDHVWVNPSLLKDTLAEIVALGLVHQESEHLNPIVGLKPLISATL